MCRLVCSILPRSHFSGCPPRGSRVEPILPPAAWLVVGDVDEDDDEAPGDDRPDTFEEARSER